MPRGGSRKIEVPRYTQPQFELGDTAEDIERGEGGERTEEGQRQDRKREDGRERKGRKSNH